MKSVFVISIFLFLGLQVTHANTDMKLISSSDRNSLKRHEFKENQIQKKLEREKGIYLIRRKRRRNYDREINKMRAMRLKRNKQSL